MMKSTSPIYINVKGQLLDLSIPQVMGILNVTPDSFYLIPPAGLYSGKYIFSIIYKYTGII